MSMDLGFVGAIIGTIIFVFVFCYWSLLEEAKPRKEFRRVSGEMRLIGPNEYISRRPVVLDTTNIGTIPGGDFDPTRILLAMKYFLEQGHKPIAIFEADIVERTEKNDNLSKSVDLIERIINHTQLNKLGLISITKKKYQRKILQTASDLAGLVMSNEQFRHLTRTDYPLRLLEERIFGYMFRGVAKKDRRFEPDYWKTERHTHLRTEELPFHQNTAALLIVDNMLSFY